MYIVATFYLLLLMFQCLNKCNICFIIKMLYSLNQAMHLCESVFCATLKMMHLKIIRPSG